MIKTVETQVGWCKLTIDDDGFGVLDSEAKRAFSKGQCHALAIAINKLTGWKIKGVGFSYDTPDSPTHCCNYSPELKAYVDIDGLSKKAPVGRVLNSNISPREAMGSLRGYLDPDVETAMPFARSVLRKINR